MPKNTLEIAIITTRQERIRRYDGSLKRRHIMRKSNINLFLSMLAIGANLGGCVSTQRREDLTILEPGAESSTKDKLYGIGVAQGIKSIPVRHATADKSATLEILRQLSARKSIAGLINKNSNEGSGNTATASSNEEVCKKIKIVNRWDEQGVAFSLATLDLDEEDNNLTK
jgi:hypothetical protein